MTEYPPLPEPAKLEVSFFRDAGLAEVSGFTPAQMHAYAAPLLERIALLEADARRWAVVLACVRQGGHGEWVILEDDPHNANGTKSMFTKAIDAAIGEQK